MDNNTPDRRFHYLPAMTRRDDHGRQQAICGAFTTPDQHRVDPAELTCWGCQMWMENVGIADDVRTA